MPLPDLEDARAYHRGYDEFQSNDRGGVGDPERVRDPEEVAGVGPARLDELRYAEASGVKDVSLLSWGATDEEVKYSHNVAT